MRSLLLPLLALVLASRVPAPDVSRFTAAPLVARAYDTILDADFDRLPAVLAATCGPAPGEACDTLAAIGETWRLAIEREEADAGASARRAADAAIAATSAWTAREPDRAEAWFYAGAALGARAQVHVLRDERLAAARDARRAMDALERALARDPAMHDARFGIGLYRYYADVAPAAFKWLRWLLLLPGGNRAEGLAEMSAARDGGELLRGEADYQLHLVYLWYEDRSADALRLADSLRARYPRNPLFHKAAADILDTYIHDPIASLRRWDDLRRRAAAGLVAAPQATEVRARLAAAVLLDAVDETDRALDLVAPIDAAWLPDAAERAEELGRTFRRRLDDRAYREALAGWRAFERGDLPTAAAAFARSRRAGPASATTRYRYAQLLIAQDAREDARAELAAAAADADVIPVIRANGLFDMATLAHEAGDDTRARSLYLEASRVFGANGRVTERAAHLARRHGTPPP